MKQEKDRNYGYLDHFHFHGSDYSISNQVFSLAFQDSLWAHQADVFRQAFKNKIYCFMELFLRISSMLDFKSKAEDTK